MSKTNNKKQTTEGVEIFQSLKRDRKQIVNVVLMSFLFAFKTIC